MKLTERAHHLGLCDVPSKFSFRFILTVGLELEGSELTSSYTVLCVQVSNLPDQRNLGIYADKFVSWESW